MSKRRLIKIAILIVCGGTACSTSVQVQQFHIPFSYPGSGVGTGAVGEDIVLGLGEEEAKVSDAIWKVVRDQNLSIQSESVGVLTEGKQYSTNTADLPRSVIDDYNVAISSTPGMLLETDVTYGVQVTLSYAIRDKNIVLSVTTTLFRRGVSGPWHEYGRPYSGPFFADRLRDALIAELKPK
jgi:hypothetical protein